MVVMRFRVGGGGVFIGKKLFDCLPFRYCHRRLFLENSM